MDIEGGFTYIITIAISTHGCVVSTLPSNKYNIQFHSVTHKELEPYTSSRAETSELPRKFNDTFRKNIPNIDETHSYHYKMLPYEKIIADEKNKFEQICNSVFTFLGANVNPSVWLISVHRKITESEDDYEYIYPKPNDMYINLLNIKGLQHLSDTFNDNKNKFTEIKKELERNNKKLTDVNDGYYDWKIELNEDKTYIRTILLSYLLDLITNIMGKNCKLNIFDFSCSTKCTRSVEKGPKIRIDETYEDPYFPYFKSKVGGKLKKNKRQRRRKTKRKSLKKRRKTKRRKI